jgi:hypothetical protein
VVTIRASLLRITEQIEGCRGMGAGNGAHSYCRDARIAPIQPNLT